MYKKQKPITRDEPKFPLVRHVLKASNRPEKIPRKNKQKKHKSLFDTVDQNQVSFDI